MQLTLLVAAAFLLATPAAAPPDAAAPTEPQSASPSSTAPADPPADQSADQATDPPFDADGADGSEANGSEANGSEAKAPPTEAVTIGEQTFKLEIAATAAARRRGLMGRPSIADDGGMLFVFPRAHVQSFWMADCTIDIDVIFLDQRGRIVALHEMKTVHPRRTDESRRAYERRLRSYSSRRPAVFAIELKAGSIRRLELKRGRTIKLDNERLMRLARQRRTPPRAQR